MKPSNATSNRHLSTRIRFPIVFFTKKWFYIVLSYYRNEEIQDIKCGGKHTVVLSCKFCWCFLVIVLISVLNPSLGSSRKGPIK